MSKDEIISNWQQATKDEKWNQAHQLRQRLLIEHNATLTLDPNRGMIGRVLSGPR